MELRLKRCTANDLDSLCQMGRQTFCEAFEQLNDPEDFSAYVSEAFSAHRIREELETPGSEFYFVFKGTDCVGYFKINTWTAQSDLHLKGSLELERVYVCGGHQGKGIGRWILDGVRKMALARGLHTLWLGVWEKNPDAIRFYQSIGFEKFGEHPYDIGKDRQTDWLMRLPLTTL